MISAGIFLVIIAVILIVLGLAWTAAHWLLWVGIVLVIVGAVLWLLGYRGRTGPPVV
jgi:hypothetical protein